MLASLRKFSGDEVAQERWRILQFYDQHGEAETQLYFGVNRKTIHVWKKRLAASGNHLGALAAHSTRPHRVRRMTTAPQVVAFIRQLRQDHPHLGKEKIKPLLDRHCQRLGLPAPAVSTIGKILRRHNLFFHPPGRAYHNPNSKWAQPTGKRRARRERVRYAPHPQHWGHWEMDTLQCELDRLRVYFYSAIELKGRWAFSLPYAHLNSRNARDFFQKLQTCSPVPIVDVQTDNGSEFAGDFDAHLLTQAIPHHWCYPRCPRINGCIERFQRTLTEEFIQVHQDLVREPPAFLHSLADYLLFYNTERIHHALANQTPLDFLLSNQQLSKMSVTYTVD